MAESIAGRSIDKRKVALFVALVIVGLACLGFMVYTLFSAKPRTDPHMQNGSHSSALRLSPAATAS